MNPLRDVNHQRKGSDEGNHENDAEFVVSCLCARSVMAMRFMNGLTSIVAASGGAQQLKNQVECLACARSLEVIASLSGLNGLVRT